MAQESKRRRSPAILIAVPAVMAMVWGASNAAFTDTTDNGTNTFAAGTVELTDNDGGSNLLFSVANMVPGDQSVNCIDVSYTGSSYGLSPVKLYGSLTSNVDDFAALLDLKIEVLPRAAAKPFGDCTELTNVTEVYNGTLAAFMTAHTDYTSGATGTTTWTPTSTLAHAGYRFTVTLKSSAGNPAQGDSAGALFTWEVQSA